MKFSQNFHGRRPDLFYYRDTHGNKVDLILRDGRMLIPIKIKSAAIRNTGRILHMLKKCLGGYLCGIGYSFAYAPETGAIDPELRKSYEQFISENTGSSYHPVVKRVYEAWKKNGFKKSDELASLLASEGYDFPIWDM